MPNQSVYPLFLKTVVEFYKGNTTDILAEELLSNILNAINITTNVLGSIDGSNGMLSFVS